MATEILFVPEAITAPWDAVEVHPVKEIEPGTCAVCEPGEAEFWSVYVHLTAGGLSCVADLETEHQAVTLAELLTAGALYFTGKKPQPVKPGRGHRISTKAEKLAFVEKHRDTIGQAVSSGDWHFVVYLSRAAGLYSNSTVAEDIRRMLTALYKKL